MNNYARKRAEFDDGNNNLSHFFIPLHPKLIHDSRFMTCNGDSERE